MFGGIVLIKACLNGGSRPASSAAARLAAEADRPL
jgi:hypothetical protein